MCHEDTPPCERAVRRADKYFLVLATNHRFTIQDKEDIMSSSRLLRLLLVTALLGGLLPIAIPPLPVRAAGEFSEVIADLPAVDHSVAAWGD